MSFQPLIVVILLIFLVLMALAAFLWFLISPGVVASEATKPKTKIKAKAKLKARAKAKPNPALRVKAEPVRQSAAVQPKKKRSKEKPGLINNKKPDLKYVEIRPEPVKIKKLQKEKAKPEQPDSKNTGQSRDNFRGLNASKVEKPKKIDPFDSFVEASKRLD